jgi:sarcosine oxidase
MPSLICSATSIGSPMGVYVLPPTPYPDGHWYAKLGTGGFDHPLTSFEELGEWFRGGPSRLDETTLYEIMTGLVPSLAGAPHETAQCVVTSTAHGYPYVDTIEDGGLCVAVGGNGTAAKSSDELGRLGAITLMGSEWPDEYDRDLFRAAFA